MDVGDLPIYLPLSISPSPFFSLVPSLSLPPSRSLALFLPLSFSLPPLTCAFLAGLGSRLGGVGFQGFLLVWGLSFARPGRKPTSLPVTRRLVMSCIYEYGPPEPSWQRACSLVLNPYGVPHNLNGAEAGTRPESRPTRLIPFSLACIGRQVQSRDLNEAGEARSEGPLARLVCLPSTCRGCQVVIINPKEAGGLSEAGRPACPAALSYHGQVENWREFGL